MARLYLLLLSLLTLGTSVACSQASSDDPKTEKSGKTGKKKHKKGSLEDTLIEATVPGLRRVGALSGVPESSGLAPADQPGTYYSFGDDGNTPTLYRVSAAGQVLARITVKAENHDWESLSRDGQGNYYIGDCGNNNSDRRDLRIYRVNPSSPEQVGTIAFAFPDQREFPPKKKQRNFDVEASLWQAGKVWLFTKDRGLGQSCKVYTVPDQPGDYEARLMTSLNIPGEVTDAALRPDGKRLVLLGRGELFILDGNSWSDILKATPKQIDLAGTGQTEGAVFKDQDTLLITTEQGGLFEYQLP
jgi:hypothetical protein